MVFVINQKKAANNNLFGNVKVIHKYNVSFSLSADLQLSKLVRSVPGADIDNISMALKIRKQANLSGEVVLALQFLIDSEMFRFVIRNPYQD